MASHLASLKNRGLGNNKWPIGQLAATDDSFTPQIYTMTTRRRREKRNSNKKKYEESKLKGNLLLLPPRACLFPRNSSNSF